MSEFTAISGFLPERVGAALLVALGGFERIGVAIGFTSTAHCATFWVEVPEARAA